MNTLPVFGAIVSEAWRMFKRPYALLGWIVWSVWKRRPRSKLHMA